MTSLSLKQSNSQKAEAHQSCVKFSYYLLINSFKLILPNSDIQLPMTGQNRLLYHAEKNFLIGIFNYSELSVASIGLFPGFHLVFVNVYFFMHNTKGIQNFYQLECSNYP